MRYPFKIRLKPNPMIRNTLVSLTCMCSSVLAFSQNSNPDSANYFLQKGLQEKQVGRRMESLKNFEKAYKYDSTNKSIVSELAVAYHDLRKFTHAKNTYKKLETLGDASPALYKQLMDLSFSLKQNDDVIVYANKLKQADPSQKNKFFYRESSIRPGKLWRSYQVSDSSYEGRRIEC